MNNTQTTVPLSVAIAIFREGMAHGISIASDELINVTKELELSEDLTESVDLDWLRSEVGVNDEPEVIKALAALSASNRFTIKK